MAINPNEYTISYSQLLKSTTIRDRVSMAQTDNTFYSQLAQALTPTQMANLFPRYYRDRLPDISGFNLATEQIAAGTFGKGLPTSVATGEASTSIVSPRKKKTKKQIEADASKTGKRNEERIDAWLEENGIDVKTIYNLIKQGTNLNDPRLRGLKDLSQAELKKIGVELYQDERGKNLVRTTDLPIEKMSDKQLKEEMRKSSYGSRAGLSEKSALIDFKSKKLKEALGIDDRQYNAYRQGIANKESRGGTYNILKGGASGKYTGAYQFGDDAMIDAARILGMKVPTKEEFSKNPELQELFMDAFTYANHKTLMQNSAYKNMSPEEKLGMLAYAHQQGGGAGLEYLKNGIPKVDGFGIPGTAFIESVQQQLETTKDQKVFDPNKEYTPEEIAQYKEEQVDTYEKQNIQKLTDMYVEQGMSEDNAKATAERVSSGTRGLGTFTGGTEDEQFGLSGTAKILGLSKVDPRLVDIMKKTSQEFPLRARLFSGKRGSGAHGKGLATDIQIFDDNGMPIPSYQSPETANIYRMFAEKAREIQMRDYPELNDKFVWGGGWQGMDKGGGGGEYGAADFMDFRIGHSDQSTMMTYKWNEGWKNKYYTEGDVLGIGTRPITPEDFESLKGFKLTDEQNRLFESKYSHFAAGYGMHGNIGKRKSELTYLPPEGSAEEMEGPTRSISAATAEKTETADPYAGKSFFELQKMFSDVVSRGSNLEDGSEESYANQRESGAIQAAMGKISTKALEEELENLNESATGEDIPTILDLETELYYRKKEEEEARREELGIGSDVTGEGLVLSGQDPEEYGDSVEKDRSRALREKTETSSQGKLFEDRVPQDWKYTFEPGVDNKRATVGINDPANNKTELIKVGLAEGGIINAKDNLKVVREDGSPTGIRVASDETAVIIPPDERRKARDIVSLDGTDQRTGLDSMDEEVSKTNPIEAPLNQAKMSSGAYQNSNQSTIPSSLGAIDYSPSALRAFARDKYVDNHGFHSAPRTIYAQK